MATGQDLQVQEKRELQKKEEATIPVRVFLPSTDIFENDDSLTVVMEMPGVDKAHLDITLKDDVLSVFGRIDASKYDKLQPVYGEYSIGHYQRSFNLSPSIVNEDRISAEMSDGVLTLTLPKAERIKPRKIAIK